MGRGGALPPAHHTLMSRAQGFPSYVLPVRSAQVTVARRIVLTDALDRVVTLRDGHATTARFIARRDRLLRRSCWPRRAETKHFHYQNSLCLRFHRCGSTIHGYGSFTATI